MDKRINIESEPLGICCYGGPLKPKAACGSCAAWQAIATPPATGETELPPLPEAKTVMQLADEFGSASIAYTPKQYREGQRDAIAHYLQARKPLAYISAHAMEVLSADCSLATTIITNPTPLNTIPIYGPPGATRKTGAE